MSKKAETHQPTRVLVWATYENDVAQIASKLPENARKYVLAPWHCDLTDRRCIHDAVVKQIIIVESGSGEPKIWASTMRCWWFRQGTPPNCKEWRS